MKTRSMTQEKLNNSDFASIISSNPEDHAEQNDPIIDFDEASRAWRQNKKCLPNGCFQYICKKEKYVKRSHK